MLIHHCLTIHGRMLIKSSKSRGFTIQYKDKKSKYDKKLLSNYKNLIKQLKARNQI